MASQALSLGELIDRGTGDLAHYRERQQPPESPLEWLGIAVTRIPELAASARTADDVTRRVRPGGEAIRASLLGSLAHELGSAAAAIQRARECLAERHPELDTADGGAQDFAELVEDANRSAQRRSEMMIGSYALFVGGAVEAAGALADAERAIAGARRWERADHERLAEIRASQLNAALTNALGGLLAYARLLEQDAARLRD